MKTNKNLFESPIQPIEMTVKVYPKKDVAREIAKMGHRRVRTASGARSRVSRWINGDFALRMELCKVGFLRHKSRKYYTQEEYDLIREYILDPYGPNL